MPYFIIMKKFNNFVFPFNTIFCGLAIPAIIFIVFVLKWLPCPMCLLQQFFIFVIMLLSLFCWIKKTPQYLIILTQMLMIITILSGVYVAADQVHLQYFSTVAPATTPLDNTTCLEVTSPFLIKTTQEITGTVKSCSEINVNETISGLSLAVYSLGFFIFLLALNLIAFFINLFKRK